MHITNVNRKNRLHRMPLESALDQPVRRPGNEGGSNVEQLRRQYRSDLQQLPDMRAFVREACQQVWQGPADTEPINRLELAVDEAATNVILHSYQGQTDQRIELIVEVDAEQASVTLLHCGRAFDPQAVPPPVFDGSRESGFGLYLIRQSVDDVQYFRHEDGRNGVRLIKKRNHFPKGE
jgi:anti-sigma regulatory factor (Ser/Thr protein kinase)